MKRINHQHAYSDGEACTNQAEASSLTCAARKSARITTSPGPYLKAYAQEMAWRKDHRRVSNGEQYLMVANAALAHPVSRQWKGYSQRASL